MNIDDMSICEMERWIECLEAAIEEYDVDIVFDRAYEMFESGE